jgi:predicted acylesterase/phospholipase RssA
MSDAMVLAGAASKGAFAAGAIRVLSQPQVKASLGLDFERIVAVSSGAFNGVYYAAAIHSGHEANAGERMARIWIEQGTLAHAFQPGLREIAGLEGFSKDTQILRTLREIIAPAPARHPITLRIVVTNADGDLSKIDGVPATTFEHVIDGTGRDFTTSIGLERLFVAVAASGALPGAYAPVKLPLDDGRTVQALDGGLTNNTPLGRALEGAPNVKRVFVVTPFPLVQSTPADLHGASLLEHVFDMLVGERLFRDLRSLERINREIDSFERAVPEPGARAAIVEALGWSHRRRVQVIQIRPPAQLPGNAFSGVWSRKLRERYVQAGIEAAQGAIAMMSAPP